MSCFGGRMNEYDRISLDRFDGKNLQSTVYFLSHLHEDHTVGLADQLILKRLKSNKDIFVYCSDVTEILLLASPKYKHLGPYIKSIKINTPTKIPIPDPLYAEVEKVTITFLPAFHCPGSVMCLIEGNEGTVLYTGDFRWEHFNIEQMHHLRSGDSVKKIKSLYVDTTFCMPENLFIPSRQQCIDATYHLIQEWTSKSSQHVVYVFLRAQFGHEPLLNAVASRLHKKIHVNSKKQAIYSRIVEFDGVFTDDGLATQIHACDKGATVEVDDDLVPCRSNHDPDKVLIILPTTMYFMQYQHLTLDKIVKKVDNKYYRVCYSFHSSYTEIKDLLAYLLPEKVYPNVKPPADTTLAETQHRLNTMLKECKQKRQEQTDQEETEVKTLGTLKTRKTRATKRTRQKDSQSEADSLDFGTPTKLLCHTTPSPSDKGISLSQGSKPSTRTGRGQDSQKSASQPQMGTRRSSRKSARAEESEAGSQSYERTPKKKKGDDSMSPDLFGTPMKSELSDVSDLQSSYQGSNRSESEMDLSQASQKTAQRCEDTVADNEELSSWSLGSFLDAVSSGSSSGGQEESGCVCLLDDIEQTDGELLDLLPDNQHAKQTHTKTRAKKGAQTKDRKAEVLDTTEVEKIQPVDTEVGTSEADKTEQAATDEVDGLKSDKRTPKRGNRGRRGRGRGRGRGTPTSAREDVKQDKNQVQEDQVDTVPETIDVEDSLNSNKDRKDITPDSQEITPSTVDSKLDTDSPEISPSRVNTDSKDITPSTVDSECSTGRRRSRRKGKVIEEGQNNDKSADIVEDRGSKETWKQNVTEIKSVERKDDSKETEKSSKEECIPSNVPPVVEKEISEEMSVAEKETKNNQSASEAASKQPSGKKEAPRRGRRGKGTAAKKSAAAKTDTEEVEKKLTETEDAEKKLTEDAEKKLTETEEAEKELTETEEAETKHTEGEESSQITDDKEVVFAVEKHEMSDTGKDGAQQTEEDTSMQVDESPVPPEPADVIVLDSDDDSSEQGNTSLDTVDESAGDREELEVESETQTKSHAEDKSNDRTDKPKEIILSNTGFKDGNISSSTKVGKATSQLKRDEAIPSCSNIENKTPVKEVKRLKFIRRRSFDMIDDFEDNSAFEESKKSLSKIHTSPEASKVNWETLEKDYDSLLCDNDDKSEHSNGDENDQHTDEEIMKSPSVKEDPSEEILECIDIKVDSDKGRNADEKVTIEPDVIDLTGEDFSTSLIKSNIPSSSEEVKKYANVCHEEKGGKKLMRISFSKVKKDTENNENDKVKFKDEAKSSSECGDTDAGVTKTSEESSEEHVEKTSKDDDGTEGETHIISSGETDPGSGAELQNNGKTCHNNGKDATLIEDESVDKWLSSSKSTNPPSDKEKTMIVVGSQDGPAACDEQSLDVYKQTTGETKDGQTKDKDEKCGENENGKRDETSEKDKSDDNDDDKERTPEVPQLTEKELEEKAEVKRQAMGFVCETDSDSDSDDSSSPPTPTTKDIYDEYIELSSGVSDTEDTAEKQDKHEEDNAASAGSDTPRTDNAPSNTDSWLSTRKSDYRPKSPVESSDDEIFSRSKNSKDQTKKVRNRVGYTGSTGKSAPRQEKDYRYRDCRDDDMELDSNSGTKGSNREEKYQFKFKKGNTRMTKHFRKRGDDETGSAGIRSWSSQTQNKNRQQVMVPSASEFLESRDKFKHKRSTEKYNEVGYSYSEVGRRKPYDRRHNRDRRQGQSDHRISYPPKSIGKQRADDYYKSHVLKPIKTEEDRYTSINQPKEITYPQGMPGPPPGGTMFPILPPAFPGMIAPPPGFFPPPFMPPASGPFIPNLPVATPSIAPSTSASNMDQLKANIFQITGLTVSTSKATTPSAVSASTVSQVAQSDVQISHLQTAKSILSSGGSDKTKPENLSALVTKLKRVTHLLETVSDSQEPTDSAVTESTLPPSRNDRRDSYGSRRGGSMEEDDRRPLGREEDWHEDERRRYYRSRYEESQEYRDRPSRHDPYYEDWLRNEDERYERDRHHARYTDRPDRFREEDYDRYPKDDPYWDRYPHLRDRYDHYRGPRRDYYPDDHPRRFPRDFPEGHPRDYPDDYQRGPRDYPGDHQRSPRDYPRDHPFDPRDYPHDPRDYPHGPRDYPRGPRDDPCHPRDDLHGPIDFPRGPRDYPHGLRDNPHGPRDFPDDYPRGPKDHPVDFPRGRRHGPRDYSDDHPSGPREYRGDYERDGRDYHGNPPGDSPFADSRHLPVPGHQNRAYPQPNPQPNPPSIPPAQRQPTTAGNKVFAKKPTFNVFCNKKPVKMTMLSRSGKVMSVSEHKVDTAMFNKPQQQQGQKGAKTDNLPAFLTGLGNKQALTRTDSLVLPSDKIASAILNESQKDKEW